MKKKGLIVATIVMVLVLAVSLTTATYAWFSSQASATVDDLAITTRAADGLQIAMTNTKKDITDLQSGELLYENGKWTGAQSTWGSFLGFSEVQQGEWANAVTYNTGTMTVLTGEYKKTSDGSATLNKTYYKATQVYYAENFPSSGSAPTKVNGVKYYTYSTPDSTPTYSPVAGDTLATETDYFTIAETVFTTDALEAVTKTITGSGFMVPTGYNSAIEPTGYEAATKNVHYYEFDMAITNTNAIYDLGMGIIITPTKTNPGDQTYPGMVAASRVELEFYKGTDSTQTGALKNGDTTVTQLEPYGAFELQGNNTMQDKSATNKKSVNGEYKIDLDGDKTNAIEAGTVWFVTVRIWIEGTDNECKNLTAGTGYNVEIEFGYAKDPSTDATYNNTYTTPNEYTVTFS